MNFNALLIHVLPHCLFLWFLLYIPRRTHTSLYAISNYLDVIWTVTSLSPSFSPDMTLEGREPATLSAVSITWGTVYHQAHHQTMFDHVISSLSPEFAAEVRALTSHRQPPTTHSRQLLLPRGNYNSSSAARNSAAPPQNATATGWSTGCWRRHPRECPYGPLWQTADDSLNLDYGVTSPLYLVPNALEPPHTTLNPTEWLNVLIGNSKPLSRPNLNQRLGWILYLSYF